MPIRTAYRYGMIPLSYRLAIGMDPGTGTGNLASNMSSSHKILINLQFQRFWHARDISYITVSQLKNRAEKNTA